MFPVEIDCTHCHDTGVCIVEIENQVKMPMACGCKTPCDWYLPKRTTEPRLEFPADWFKPANGIAGVFGQKMQQWLAKIKLAEEYWEHQNQKAIK